MNSRILVIDDDQQVIETYQEIFEPGVDEIDILADVVGVSMDEGVGSQKFPFRVSSATQGEEGVQLANMACEMGQPFAVAMVDMRMPPGWDGLRTAEELRKIDENIYIIIVTAYTDRSVEEIHGILKRDALLIYKPFTSDEIYQLARTLCISWNDRQDKCDAFEEVERLASYPEESPGPVLRYSSQGELLYANHNSDSILSMMGALEVGDVLVGAWLKRIKSVYEDGRMVEIEAASGSQFFLFTLAPIPAKGYVNCYAKNETRRYLLTRQLTYQARHDSLTGLINRGEFIRKLNLVLRRIRAQNEAHALLYLDMEHFKDINDTSGHIAGDNVLQELSNMLLNEVKDGDVLSRIGGDEYAMLVYNVNSDQARSVGGRINRAVEKQIFRWKGEEFRLGGNIGVAMIDQNNLGDAQELLNRADQACYAAKELGGDHGNIYVYDLDRSVSEQRSEAIELANEVQEAIHKHNFQLYLQPLLYTGVQQQGEMRYEVLLRMENSSGELVNPALFIPESERFDLAAQLDYWVIENGFKRIAEKSEDQSVYIFKISESTLIEEGFELFVRDQIESLGVDPAHLIFEITEEVAYTHMMVFQHFIQ